MPKFKEGDIVVYIANRRLNRLVPPGEYKVVAVMPREDSQIDFSYRLRHISRNVDCVAVEGDLVLHG